MKTTPSARCLLILALATATALSAGSSSAQTVSPNPAPTIITSAPYTISAAGYYQLGANLSYAGNGSANDAIITVAASNVTLDLAGHYLSGPTSGSNVAASTLYGIYASERAQLTIQNGTVSHCYVGILLTGNGTATSNFNNARVQNMVISRCLYEGIELENVTNADILNNRFALIGGSSTQTSVWGVYSYGTGIRVSGNALSSLTAGTGGNSIGIEIDPSVSGGSLGGFVYGNQITGANNAIVGGKYQQNLTDGCATPVSNGQDAGLND